MKDRHILEINVDDIGRGGVYSLVKNVIEHKSAHENIDIASLEHFENEKDIEILNDLGCKVYFVGHDGNKLLKQIYIYINLKKLLLSSTYDCVHIHADVANKLLVSGLAAKKAGVRKIILHSHAAGVDGNKRWLKKIYHYICRRHLKNIGTIFAACSDLAAKWMYPNVALSNIIIINNGVDLEEFRFNGTFRKKTRSELGISDSDILLGHIGRFAYQKNHEFILKIAEGLKKRGLTFKILLVGEGPLETEIKEEANQLDVTENLIFYGTSNKVHELLSAMDIFLLPSHFEGLPIVGVEAQAAGLPSIFSDQITREVKLTKNVSFIGITDSDVDKWNDEIIKDISLPRVDTYNELKKKRFDIKDTVQAFEALYSGE